MTNHIRAADAELWAQVAILTDMGKAPPPLTKWRHLKTGRDYFVVGCAFNESDLSVKVVYGPDHGEGPWWIRPVEEFMDGRFVRQE